MTVIYCCDDNEHARTKLKALGNQDRFRFEGTFARSGFKTSYERGNQHCTPTLLLKDVHQIGSDDIVCDHLWFNYTKGFLKLGRLVEGDIVQFDGRVDRYIKGSIGEEKSGDYKITRPTKVISVQQASGELIPLDDKPALIGYILKDNAVFYTQNSRRTEDDHYYRESYRNWCYLHHLIDVDYSEVTVNEARYLKALSQVNDSDEVQKLYNERAQDDVECVLNFRKRKYKYNQRVARAKMWEQVDYQYATEQLQKMQVETTLQHIKLPKLK